MSCALALLLNVQPNIAHAQSDFDRENDRRSMTATLYNAYRDYQYVKMCHDRQHFWETLISDDELQKAKDKILIIETDTLAWLNDAWNKEQNVNSDALYTAAGESLYAAPIDKQKCREELQQLFAIKSSAGKAIKKDF